MQVMSNTNKLVIDIETIGEDFDALDKATQENITRWIKRESGSEEEYKIALEDLKNGLGFSPLTGEIVAIGIARLSQERGRGILSGARAAQRGGQRGWREL